MIRSHARYPLRYTGTYFSFFLKRKRKGKTYTPQIGIEPTTFRLTAERANQLRH
jgi:hypothetical protein